MAGSRLDAVRRHLQGRDGFQQLSAHNTAAIAEVPRSPHFFYTLDNPRLTWEQRQFYEENGYLVIPKLVNELFLDECIKRFVDLCEGRLDRGGMVLMRDISLAKTGATGQLLYNKLQDFIWDDVLSRYILAPEILDYVECFTGPNIMAIHTMLINKPPDSGKMTSRHPLHQDLHYFPMRPPERIVASWTAMEEISEHNGCLFVLPGTHKGILHQHDYPDWEGGVNKAFHGVQGYDDYPKKMLTMSKGDTVFFHPLLLHGSGANLTTGFRKAISCHYAASECHYADVAGTTQDMIAREVEDMGKQRGIELNFQEAWHVRSRLARGSREIVL